MMKRGDYVQYWFDTGAMGHTILYGLVVASGPKTYTVKWQSGIRNRVHQDRPDIKLIDNDEMLTEAQLIFTKL